MSNHISFRHFESFLSQIFIKMKKCENRNSEIWNSEIWKIENSENKKFRNLETM